MKLKCFLGIAISTLCYEVFAAPVIEEVIVTAELSRYSALKSDTPVMEVARSISIETELDFMEKGALSLDSTLGYSSGVFANVYGFATRGDWIHVRGLKAPLYQDSLQSLFGNYNNARPDIFSLEQVEVLKGPASVLYGKGSPGGIVNVISKRPQSEASHKLGLEIGNFNRKELNLDTTGVIGTNSQWLYRLLALKRDSDSQVQFVDEDTTLIAPSITWLPSADTEVTLLMNYRATQSDTGSQFLPIEGTLLPSITGQKIASDTYLGDKSFNKYDTKTKSLTLLANHQFNDIFSGELTARKTRGESDYQQAWANFMGGAFRQIAQLKKNPATVSFATAAEAALTQSINMGTIPRTFYKSDASSDQKVIDIRGKLNIETGRIQHNILMGTQYQKVDLSSNNKYPYAAGLQSLDTTLWVNVFNPVYPDNSSAINSLIAATPAYTRESDTKDFGIYLHDQMTIDAWNISLGLRRDRVSNEAASGKQNDSAISKSVGVLYEFDNGVSPYINYAESFDPVVGDNGAGEALKPQRGEQNEIGIKYQSNDGKLLLTTAYFNTTVKNLPDPRSLIGTIKQQRGESKGKGYELESKWRINQAFNLELNLTKLDAKDQNGLQAISVPEKQASLWLGYQSQDIVGLKAGLGVRYVGQTYGGKYRSLTQNLQQEIYTPSYTLADAMLAYEVNNWSASINIRNIANKEYYASCLSRGDCFVGEERTVVGSLNYRF